MARTLCRVSGLGTVRAALRGLRDFLGAGVRRGVKSDGPGGRTALEPIVRLLAVDAWSHPSTRRIAIRAPEPQSIRRIHRVAGSLVRAVSMELGDQLICVLWVTRPTFHFNGDASWDVDPPLETLPQQRRIRQLAIWVILTPSSVRIRSFLVPTSRLGAPLGSSTND